MTGGRPPTESAISCLMPATDSTLVVFDAMGVLYQSADDVGDLLVPYLREKGCRLGQPRIEDLYRQCSLGRMSAAAFWDACDVAGDDAEYCGRHALSDGIVDLLDRLAERGVPMAVLSNDVSEWSRKLRRRFSLETWIDSWVISGDVGVRKPDPAIFRLLLERTSVAPDAVIFFDDREANVEAARRVGMRAHVFHDAGAARLTLTEDIGGYC